MVKYVDNPPEALSLMTSARSFGNYDLAGALSDLIDNSLKARARRIQLLCVFDEGSPEVRVTDNGHGMSEADLRNAMRPASQNPLEERAKDDLGRFGWGLKSASFSQCTRLTVISTKDGDTSGACWDLDALRDWRMEVLSRAEIAETVSEMMPKKHGTEVIWQNCDRLSENGTMKEREFNELVAHTKNRLALTYHKYLSGQVRGRKLSITLNGQLIEPYDPFHAHHNATQQFPSETVIFKGRKIKIRPYILPHYSKLKKADHEKLAGDDGFLKNQGFYIYRNHRLIIGGTWFRLVKYGELSQLVRISVEIPNSLDDLWKITVDKSDAQLPAVLRERLRKTVHDLRRKSSRVHRSKGGQVPSGTTVAIWERYARSGEVNYHINRDHPLVATLFELGQKSDRGRVTAALRAIEQGFPVDLFGRDTVNRPDDIHQTEARGERFRDFLDTAIPVVLARENGDYRALRKKLRCTEPFCLNWKPVEEYLEEKGWIDDRA